MAALLTFTTEHTGTCFARHGIECGQHDHNCGIQVCWVLRRLVSSPLHVPEQHMVHPLTPLRHVPLAAC
jgi:hypothetical protein